MLPASPPTPPLVPKWDGMFTDYMHWTHKASSWLDRDSVCVDTLGRRCRIGKDFMRARDDGTFPVRFFSEMETAKSVEYEHHHRYNLMRGGLCECGEKAPEGTPTLKDIIDGIDLGPEDG